MLAACPTVKLLESKLLSIRSGDMILVSMNTGNAVASELRAVCGDRPRNYGFEQFVIAEHRVICSPFIPDGEVWKCQGPL